MGRRIVAVGGSAGCIRPLRQLLAGLSVELGICVLVTVHINAVLPSVLPAILDRTSMMSAAHAVDGTRLQPNTIVVAPPDRHLLAVAGHARLGAGPKVKLHRPSVDVMFRSAAEWAGPDLVAVVLSGLRDDGAAGATSVADAGGTVFVQDPAEAAYSSMPHAALDAVPTARTSPGARLATRLTERWRV